MFRLLSNSYKNFRLNPRKFSYFATPAMESNPWYKDKVYPEWGQADKLYFAQNTNMNYTGFAKAWGADVSGKVRIIPYISYIHTEKTYYIFK